MAADAGVVIAGTVMPLAEQTELISVEGVGEEEKDEERESQPQGGREVAKGWEGGRS